MLSAQSVRTPYGNPSRTRALTVQKARYGAFARAINAYQFQWKRGAAGPPGRRKAVRDKVSLSRKGADPASSADKQITEKMPSRSLFEEIIAAAEREGFVALWCELWGAELRIGFVLPSGSFGTTPPRYLPSNA